ncbi:MAG: uracil-DNA glycosylase family protein [Saprospiraceae bacterium]
MTSIEKLQAEISSCTTCSEYLAHGVNPVCSFGESSRIAIIGQAPGRVVHASGIPWDDKSGARLRDWLGVDNGQFYDPELFAIVPMGFCYPGKGKSGDLPPRPECAPKWHDEIFDQLPDIRLWILIGSYAQSYYLQKQRKRTLTETVKTYSEYLPKFMVLPHPSPRNNIWMAKNEWFAEEVLPVLKQEVAKALR